MQNGFLLEGMVALAQKFYGQRDGMLGRICIFFLLFFLLTILIEICFPLFFFRIKIVPSLYTLLKCIINNNYRKEESNCDSFSFVER